MNILPHNNSGNISCLSKRTTLQTPVLKLGVFLLCAMAVSGFIFGIANAESVTELKTKIQDRGQKISELEKEIALYQAEMNQISREKQTLQSAIRSLDLSGKKIEADINATENKIDVSLLQIRQLELQIELQEQKMDRGKEALAQTFKRLNEAQSVSLIENLLSHDNLADFWKEMEYLERFKVGVRNNYASMKELKQELEETTLAIEGNLTNLAMLKSELAGKYGAVEANKNEKSDLLKITASEESKYQSILAEKQALRASFEREMREFESQLHFSIDPTRVPPAGRGVLAWPLDSVSITQYFGNTAFALSGAYNGQGHNGIDLRAPVGTPVKAALGGVIEGMGDTDTVCRNASWGRWILIRHSNGLSTMYAHLSGFNVNVGQTISTGSIIGYTGNTGYSTGPHLHFTVYATQGVKIMQVPSRACGGVYTMPVADLEAYLDPMRYL